MLQQGTTSIRSPKEDLNDDAQNKVVFGKE